MQRLILTELDHGLRPKEIAELRHLSICTVRMHIRHALSRLEANSYLAAIRKAQQAGLLESTDPILEIRQN